MQRLMTIAHRGIAGWRTRRTTAPGDNVATIAQQHGDAVAKRWWYWRHYFLEAKRQQLDAQRDQ